MPRLANKSFTGRAPQTAGAVPELPDFSPQLAELPGGTETNAAMQRWWDLVSQRIEFNNAGTAKRFFEVKAQFTDADTSLSAEITEERIVRADEDAALAYDILTVSATVDGLSATVETLSLAMATAEGYLEARWTINVSAGPIVTGMTLFSASGPDTNVSYIAFQADRFQVNTATSGNKQIFSATATEVKLGNVFTVDLTNTKVFVGTGTYANANTYFYVDTVGGGRMSLGSKFVWDGSALTIVGSITATTGSIGGWLIGANYIVDAAGLVGLSSAVTGGDDIRFWAGNLTAGSAPFRVTEAGVLTASSGTVGGWTLSSTTLSASNVTISSAGTIVLGTASDVLYLSAADVTYRLWAGNATAASATFSVTKAGVLFATGATITGSFSSGTSPNWFNADTSGIWLGGATFGVSPFRVSMAGALTSTSGTIAGFTINTTGFTTGTGASFVQIQSTGATIQFGSGTNQVAVYSAQGLVVTNSGGVGTLAAFLGTSGGANQLIVYNNSSSATLNFNGTSGILSVTGDLYTSGAGATKVGCLNAAGSTAGTTYVGLRYDSGNTRAELAALSGTVAWRDILIAPNAYIMFGTHVAIGAETLTGYIYIKDAGGTLRKVAIVS